MDILMEYLPFFIPLILLQLTLMIVALVHIFRHPYYRHGNRMIWVFVVILVQTIGPIAYFVFGRGEE